MISVAVVPSATSARTCRRRTRVPFIVGNPPQISGSRTIWSCHLKVMLPPDPDLLYLHAQPLGDGEHVLVAAAAEIHHQQIVLGQSWRELGDMRQRMRRLECRDDALELAQELERRQRLVVG